MYANLCKAFIQRVYRILTFFSLTLHIDASKGFHLNWQNNYFIYLNFNHFLRQQYWNVTKNKIKVYSILQI